MFVVVGNVELAAKQSTSLKSKKSSSIDYSITSAYEPMGSAHNTLPTSSYSLQRTTSHKNPPRPSLYSQQPPFYRTNSTSGTNGKRPVPAPRLSLSSRSDADYQTVDMSMPDVQIKEGASPAHYSPAVEAFLYPPNNNMERQPSQLSDTSNGTFHRSSTLPVSRGRPELTSISPPNRSDYSPTHTQHMQLSHSESHSSTSSQPTSKKEAGASNLVRRLNSRSSLTDLEKKERRKSQLLETSPYPKLSSLVMDDNSKTSHNIDNGSTNISEPIYSQISKPSYSTTRVTASPFPNNLNGEGNSSADNASHTTNTIVNGAESHTPMYSATSSLSPSRSHSPIYERLGAIYSSSRSARYGNNYSYNPMLHNPTGIHCLKLSSLCFAFRHSNGRPVLTFHHFTR